MKKKTVISKADEALKKLRDIFIQLGEKQLELAKILRWTEEVKDIKNPSKKLLQTAEQKYKRINTLVKEIQILGEEVNDLQGLYEDLSSKFDLKPKVPSYINDRDLYK